MIPALGMAWSNMVTVRLMLARTDQLVTRNNEESANKVKHSNAFCTESLGTLRSSLRVNAKCKNNKVLSSQMAEWLITFVHFPVARTD